MTENITINGEATAIPKGPPPRYAIAIVSYAARKGKSPIATLRRTCRKLIEKRAEREKFRYQAVARVAVGEAAPFARQLHDDFCEHGGSIYISLVLAADALNGDGEAAEIDVGNIPEDVLPMLIPMAYERAADALDDLLACEEQGDEQGDEQDEEQDDEADPEN